MSVCFTFVSSVIYLIYSKQLGLKFSKMILSMKAFRRIIMCRLTVIRATLSITTSAPTVLYPKVATWIGPSLACKY